jgi:hypothetical protein
LIDAHIEQAETGYIWRWKILDPSCENVDNLSLRNFKYLWLVFEAPPRSTEELPESFFQPAPGMILCRLHASGNSIAVFGRKDAVIGIISLATTTKSLHCRSSLCYTISKMPIALVQTGRRLQQLPAAHPFAGTASHPAARLALVPPTHRRTAFSPSPFPLFAFVPWKGNAAEQ